MLAAVRHREAALTPVETKTCSARPVPATTRHRKWVVRDLRRRRHPKIALAVLLRGSSRQVIGPTAAQVAGHIYRRLREQNYFATPTAPNDTVKPVTVVNSGN
jgi:hypothetical protein